MIFVMLTIASGCQWKDPTGHIYDLTALDKPDGWQVQDQENGMGMFSMIYIFNFCDFSKIKCHEKEVAVMEALAVMGQVTENCDVAGQLDTQRIEYLDNGDISKGLRVTYALGDLCMDGKGQPNGPMTPRQSIFSIECGPNEDTFEVIPDNECVDQFKIKHQVACRSSTGSHWFIWTIFFIVMYFAAGFIYNRKVKNIEGEEAIPHIHQLKTLAPLIMHFLHLAFVQIKSVYMKYRGGYSQV